VVAVQGLVVGVFVLVHLFADRLRFLDGIPRSRWLSLGGGISVAYVFVHLFPELQEAQRNIDQAAGAIAYVEHHAYLLALLGLVVFYGLERAVKLSREPRRGQSAESDDSPVPAGVFWLHLGSFAVYNALIGYLLVHREEQDVRGLLLFSVAMALHFLVNDYGLREDHRASYRELGRWLLAAAVLMGWLVGLSTEISEQATGALFAFLAGGVVLNVLKEELPEERRSRFSAFASGVAVYTLLLLLL
jgi:zinc transporter ZupT